MGIRLHWSFEDTAEFEGTLEEKLIKFREARDLIDRWVHSWLLELGEGLTG